VRRRTGLSASDRKFPPLTGRSGTQRARRLASHTTVGRSAPWSSSPPSDLRITRVFSCVARGFKARPSFMFAGGCWWRSLAVDGGSGTPRGHGSVMRRPGSQWDGAVERPSAFQAGHIPSWRGSCECYALSPVAAACRWSLLLLSPLLSTRRRSSGSKPTRTLQGMARVRSGQAAAWPLASDRSVRRGSRVKRDFACAFTRYFYLCSLSCGYSCA
jgi:hypothetical protein